MNDVVTPERFPSLQDARIYALRHGGHVAGSAHVAVSAVQTGDDVRIRFRPLYGWTLSGPVTAFGLELFGMAFQPVPLPRTYRAGEYVESSVLDLRMVEARVEPAEVLV